MNGVGLGGSEHPKKYLYIKAIVDYHSVFLNDEDGQFIRGGTGILNADMPAAKYLVKIGSNEYSLVLEEDSEYEETVFTVSKHLFDEPTLCKLLDEIPKEDLVWLFRGASGLNEHYMVLYRKHELKKIK